ncbi:hypothetical protein [Massilia sp. SYSU DXS3249]
MTKLCSFLALVAVLLCSAGRAGAAPSIGNASFYNTNKIINSIIQGTPGVTTHTTTGTGVTVASQGGVGLAGKPGLSIPIAAQSTLGPGRFAGIAAKAMKVGSFVGIATMVLPWVADQYGVKVCPPPDFFCMPGPDVPAPYPDNQALGGYYVNFNTTHWGWSPLEACKRAFKAAFGSENGAYIDQYGGCATRWAISYIKPDACPAGTLTRTDATGRTYCANPGPMAPATESGLGDSLEKAMTNNPARLDAIYKQMRSDGIAVFNENDPVTVTASPVTGAPETSVTTKANPDGSTDRIETKTETKVTPQVTGNTLGNTQISYPTTTTTTTTTTNNVTNVTYQTTNITNAPVAPAPDSVVNPPANPPLSNPDKPAAEPLPKDYNREATQQKILDALTAPITATAPTGDDQLAAQKTKIAEGVTAVSGITEGSTGLKGWMPAINGTACVNPKVPNPLSGNLVDVNICDSVNLFAKFFGAVISVLALYGCIREVQSALKA